MSQSVIAALFVGIVLGTLFMALFGGRPSLPDILSADIVKASAAVEEWEHGYKTDRVIATRYNNPSFGYNIGFQFPKDINNADRAEVGDFMQAHGGWIFEGGGYPGAEAYAKFKDVTDKESANKKLKEILPALDHLMVDMSLGKKIPRHEDPDAKKWPDTDAPDKSDPYWEFNNNLNVNNVSYKKAEVSPGKWQWVEDRETNERTARYEARKRELFYALRTRVLTDSEMKEAVSYGDNLNIQPMVPYYADDKSRELNDAFLQQQRLRAVQQSSEGTLTP